MRSRPGPGYPRRVTVPDEPADARTGLSRYLGRAGRLHPLLVVLVGLAALAFGQGIPQVVLYLAMNRPTGFPGLVLSLASFAGVWVLLGLWLHLVENRRLTDLGLWGRPTALLGGAGVAVAMLLLVALLGQAFGSIRSHWTGRGGDIGIAVLMLVLFTVQGSAEEIVFRGYVMQTVAATWGMAAGLAMETVLFALVHLGNSGVSWIAVLNVAGCGVMIGLLVILTGNLWAAIGYHAVWNWLEGTVLGFQVSGLGVRHSLWTRTTSGPRWLTGGQFGPEGSVLTTGAILVGVVILAMVIRRRTVPWRRPVGDDSSAAS